MNVPEPKLRPLDEIMDELTWVTDQIALGENLSEWQEDLIREMNSHPDLDRKPST